MKKPIEQVQWDVEYNIYSLEIQKIAIKQYLTLPEVTDEVRNELDKTVIEIDNKLTMLNFEREALNELGTK